MGKNLALKILPFLIAINAPVAIGLIFKLNLLTIFIATITVSAMSYILLYKAFLPFKQISLKAYALAVGHTRGFKTSDDEAEIISKSLEQITNTSNQTYAQIASQRDILASEKNRLAAVFLSLLEAVIVLDIHKRVLMANTAAEKITGYLESEMIKKNIDDLIFFTNKDEQKITSEQFAPIQLSPNQPLDNVIFREPVIITGKNHKKSQVKLTSRPIESGVLVDLGCVLVFHETFMDQSLETMQMDFVSMASHELRTPLTSIVGYLSVLADEAKNKLSTEQESFLTKSLTSAKQLQSLISNLLNVSKVERGAISVNTQPLDWIRILNQAVDDSKLQATQKNIILELEIIDPTLPKVQADQVRVLEVLNNLIGNAINYTSMGGTIKVSAKLQGQEVITSVADNGSGIPPEAQKHLFRKFFRVTNAQDKSSNSKGTGLGLYLSKSVIDLHHGKIWVQSQVGRGSTFYFTLPIANIQSNKDGDLLSKLGLSSTGKGLTL